MTENHILEADLSWNGMAFVAGLQLEILPTGRFGRIGVDLSKTPERLEGRAVLPGFVNAHSHAFQRGLRGRGEHFPDKAGDFWSWRQAMYELVEGLDEQSAYELSLQAFREMRGAGITCVGEFHYLHHAAGGEDFALDAPVVEAARRAGVRLVLLYAYYRTGGFRTDGSERPLEGGQRRFRIGSPEAYWKRMATVARSLEPDRERLGAVVHSVRAASPAELASIHSEARRRGLPFHLHLEEQRREIQECGEAHGKSPLDLVLSLGALRGTTAVHLTHSAAEGLNRFGAAGGGAVLCPTTEANLGDGVADLPTMLHARLPLALGTDSNTRISVLEEMRWLELVQRLEREGRGVLRDEAGGVAPRLLQIATRGGALALNAPAGAFEPGRWADFVELDLEHPSIAGWTTETLAESLVFGAADGVIVGSHVGGRRQHGPESPG